MHRSPNITNNQLSGGDILSLTYEEQELLAVYILWKAYITYCTIDHPRRPIYMDELGKTKKTSEYKRAKTSK